MTSVKTWLDPDEVHIAVLVGMLHQRFATAYDPEQWDGLRISHLRVITAVPPDGVSITALAERVGMTKQGCGQFVTSLVESGHLEIGSTDDRRLRLVSRTETGESIIRRQTAHLRAMEEEWADQVGPRRYATFRKVLDELAWG